jgi:hypothetical protein
MNNEIEYLEAISYTKIFEAYRFTECLNYEFLEDMVSSDGMYMKLM